MPAQGLTPPRLGLVAGGGGLPLALAAHCRAVGRPVTVLRLEGFADPALAAYEGRAVGLGRFGETVEALRAAGCRSVCFAGAVSRPDFMALDFDAVGRAAAPSLVAAARAGDDALLRAVAAVFEAQGFAVEGAHAVMASLALPAGALGARAPSPEHMSDIARALDVARRMGALEIGQGAVVARGLVLAVEAQEGTDAMLARVAALPEALRGVPTARAGVLAKAPKPIQDLRLDMPTLGVRTVEGAAQAGLAGIAGEAGAVLVVDRDAVIAAADRLGLFVVGVEPAP